MSRPRVTPSAGPIHRIASRRGARCALGALVVGLAASAQAAPWTVEVRDASGQPLPQSVVAVYVKGQHSVAPAGTRAEIGQKQRQFQPQLTVVQTGTAVVFPNFDTVRHHVYSFSPIARFELKLYSGTPAAPVVFDKPGTATMGCNIHDRMQAWVHVVDTPLYAITDAAGRAQLDVPPGEHQLQLWHPRWPEDRAPRLQPLSVPSTGGATTVALDLPPAP